MLKNVFDLPVTTHSAFVVETLDRFLISMLSFSKEAEVIHTAIAVAPTCAIANAYVASLYLLVGSHEALSQAKPYLQAAQQYQSTATTHERLFIEAIAAWARQDMVRATAAHEALAAQFPRALLSVQLFQFHYANTGNTAGLLRIAEQILPANSNNPFAYAILAFGLEENYRLSEAETWGRKATEVQQFHPWADHAVAHVLEMQGRLEDGITWMNSVSETWTQCGSSFYTHLWWHTALFHLELEDIATVLALYDRHVWGGARKSFARAQIHSIALLARLELWGVNVGDRWQIMLPYLCERINEHVIPFWDLHFIYAMTRAGREDWATEMLADLQAYAAQALPAARSVWADVALPAAFGVVAQAKGDWATAVTKLESVRDRFYLLGGSHVQRDLFEQIYLHSLIQAEENSKALNLLSLRATSRRNTPVIQRQVNQIQRKLAIR